MKYIILTIFLLCSIWFTGCATQPAYVPMDDFNGFRYDVYRALDSLRHGQYPRYDGPTWEMR